MDSREVRMTRMRFPTVVLTAVLGAVLAGCATIPEGPTVSVMPGPGKPFDQFRADDAVCRQFAKQQLGANPNEVARQQVLSGAAVGAALGAVSGALMGNDRYDRNQAGTMAGMGVLMGSAVGASAAAQSNMTLQQRYNVSYEQCMYAKGNIVRGYPAPHYVPPPAPNTPPPPAAKPSSGSTPASVPQG